MTLPGFGFLRYGPEPHGPWGWGANRVRSARKDDENRACARGHLIRAGQGVHWYSDEFQLCTPHARARCEELGLA